MNLSVYTVYNYLIRSFHYYLLSLAIFITYIT